MTNEHHPEGVKIYGLCNKCGHDYPGHMPKDCTGTHPIRIAYVTNEKSHLVKETDVQPKKP